MSTLEHSKLKYLDFEVPIGQRNEHSQEVGHAVSEEAAGLSRAKLVDGREVGGDLTKSCNVFVDRKRDSVRERSYLAPQLEREQGQRIHCSFSGSHLNYGSCDSLVRMIMTSVSERFCVHTLLPTVLGGIPLTYRNCEPSNPF